MEYTIEKKTQALIKADPVAKRMVEVAKKKWSEMEHTDLFRDLANTGLKVEFEVRLVKGKYYTRMNFMNLNQVLRYEITTSGAWLHANCFEVLGKGNRNMISLGGNNMDAVLGLIYAEYPAPADMALYKIEKKRSANKPQNIKTAVAW